MRLHEEGVRPLIAAALLAFMVIVAAYLWFIDLLTKQGEFTIFLGAELASFSLLLYLSTRPSYAEVKKAWFLVGCLAIAFFLTLAILK